MSAPDPNGGGARIAMNEALRRAGIEAGAIDYINLHGTATVQNDAMESRAVADLFGLEVAVSSTKPFTGHTLGAAGAVEAAFCWLAMQDDNDEGLLPPHLWDGERDPALPALNVARAGCAPGPPAPLRAQQFVCLRRLERGAGVREGRMTLPDIRTLVPHSGAMSLLDTLLAADAETWRPGDDRPRLDVLQRRRSRRLGRRRVHGAGGGRACRLRGAAARRAGARRLPARYPALRLCRSRLLRSAACLNIHVQRALQGDNGLGAFDCRITDGVDGAELASATITVFQPDHVEEFLQRSSE
jgi:3-oxoacyl-[acyl-carrier-protein] synthase-1